ncbi:MAG: pirin family protein [Bacteroidetes bacterium]|nr:pirin family protein [Bacteroidota bacterium]
MKRIERIIPQPVAPGMVGDGFRVYNYIPGGGNIDGTDIPQERISPFLLLDFNAEIDFGPSDRVRGVDVHPHKGFETITIAYKGSVAHHDSAGNSGVVGPGDVQWMTAGSGILHKEYHEEEFSKKGGPFEMIQLWVNLRKQDKSVAPHYQTITRSQMGKVSVPGGEVNVIAGNFNGHQGPAQTYTPIHMYDIRLSKGGSVETSLPAKYNTALLLVEGSAEVNGVPASEHSFVLFANEGEDISIKASENAVILLLSGEPIDEPIVAYGPFVMNTQAEVIESIREAQAGKFGVLE